MPLAKGVPGHGWKCATINVQRLPFWLLLPFALPGVLMMRVPALYRALWQVGQDALGVRETLLDANLMTGLHRYTIEWKLHEIRFLVDDALVLVSPFAIAGRMGFIAWVDNQYAVVTPQGQFGWGLVDVPAAQTLWLHDIRVMQSASDL